MAFASLSDLRAARDQALQDSDFHMLPDSPIRVKYATNLATVIDCIAAYRQDLRDVTEGVDESSVGDIELPTLVLPS